MPCTRVPTYAQRFLLLATDPVSGRLFPVPRQVFDLTLAGALLFDASFHGLINDDWQKVTVLKPTDSGDAALEEALRCLSVFEDAIPIDQALAPVAARAKTLHRLVLESLQSSRSLSPRKRTLRDPTPDQELFSPDLGLVIAAHQTIRDAVLREEIPDADVPALISLMVAGGLTPYVLKPEEADRRKERISLLASMEGLGREILRAVRSLESVDLYQDAARVIGLPHGDPAKCAGGIEAVLSSLGFLFQETGMQRSRKIMTKLNQIGGFECPGCAWPNADHHRSRFAFCENGAKNVSAEATTRLIGGEFFAKWAVPDLLLAPNYWLEQQGRLTEPMILEEGAAHYRPVSWEQAFAVVANELTALADPNEAVFYASGRTSNEAAFVYQLFARALGTNNLPTCGNLCHGPSGVALARSLGYGKGSVRLEDFPKADAIFIFGHNPGSNHPRMLSSLQEAVRSGCKIVAVNPMLEASLQGFANPQEARAYVGKQTTLAQLYLQPTINGDMALIRGIAKATLEAEDRAGGILDHDFIRQHCSGFESYRDRVMNTPWEVLVTASGVEKRQIVEAAEVYYRAKNVIASWCLGITHHSNAVHTIREMVNLLLLRGNIGKPGAGVCPVRGHSNIQGVRTAGVDEDVSVSFLESLESHYGVSAPREAGMGIIQAFNAMASGWVKILVSLGGNLAAALPDTTFAEQALRRCRLTVMISTKLNRSHLVTGKRALLLPCLARSEEDIQNGVKQVVSIEDSTGKIGFSQGCLPPASGSLRSEVSIISGMAAAVLGDRSRVDWKRLGEDYQAIRVALSQTVPALAKLDSLPTSGPAHYLANPLRKRIFQTVDGKAHFSDSPLEQAVPELGELLLMTIRSHDQFNTSIFGLNDRYRGIRNERRVLFMNRQDMEERNIAPEQTVDLTSNYDHQLRKLEGYYAIPYPIKPGCVAAYFPESNRLIPINHICTESGTPAYKSVRVRVSASALAETPA